MVVILPVLYWFVNMENDKIIKKEIGQRLRKFRENQLKIERPEWAKIMSRDLRIKISDSTLQKWEEISPSWTFLKWFHDRYRKTWNWIIEEKEPEIEP
jgi:hypothetical protein